MEITFLGTGEACDYRHPNTSILIDDGENCHLLDCGFTTPHIFGRHCRDINRLKTVWLSHFHGDHFFGLPLLILGLHQMGREEPLTILAGTMARDTVEQIIELAYPGFLEKLRYPLHYQTVAVDTPIEHSKLFWQAAPTIHSNKSFGLHLRHEDKKLYYSGDGKATPESIRLMNNCDLIIHEAFSLTDMLPGHGSVEECIALATTIHYKKFALVHLAQETRVSLRSAEMLLEKAPIKNISIAKDGESIIL